MYVFGLCLLIILGVGLTFLLFTLLLLIFDRNRVPSKDLEALERNLEDDTKRIRINRRDIDG